VNENSFSYERLCTKTRFEKEATRKWPIQRVAIFTRVEIRHFQCNLALVSFSNLSFSSRDYSKLGRFKMEPTFESVDKIPTCDHLNESFLAVVLFMTLWLKRDSS